MIETKAVIDILAREASLDPATLTSETVIRNLAMDSLGMMNVMFGLEETAGVELEVEEMNEVITIGDLVRLIDTKAATPGTQT